jgi:hypothetical protein
MRIILFFAIISGAMACAVLPKGEAGDPMTHQTPDYANPMSWAALPDREDEADKTPDGLQDMQQTAEADVFFLHPTTYTGARGQKNWNAPTDQDRLNQKTDATSIRYQASIFNGAGRVFAPRYQQAHLHAYYAKGPAKIQAEKAFEIAYQDVRAAFDYYLKHFHNGRPIVIAAHSQGTTHAKRLLRDYFDGQPLQNRLVAAYLVGIPVEKSFFPHLKPCESETETGCYVSWRSFRSGYLPKSHQAGNDIVATNPLLWTTSDDYAAAALNTGAVLWKFEKLLPGFADAKVNDGLLWVTKPRFPGSIFFTRRNYHVGDLNFYYTNVRENAMLRVRRFHGD